MFALGDTQVLMCLGDTQIGYAYLGDTPVYVLESHHDFSLSLSKSGDTLSWEMSPATYADSESPTYSVSFNGGASINCGASNSYSLTSLSPGDYTAVVTAVCSHDETVSGSLDFNVPIPHADFTITINSYSDNDTTITWEESVSTEIVTYQVSIDGGTAVSTGSTASYDISSLASGSHTISVVGTCQHGNSVTKELSFTVPEKVSSGYSKFKVTFDVSDQWSCTELGLVINGANKYNSSSSTLFSIVSGESDTFTFWDSSHDPSYFFDGSTTTGLNGTSQNDSSCQGSVVFTSSTEYSASEINGVCYYKNISWASGISKLTLYGWNGSSWDTLNQFSISDSGTGWIAHTA